MCAGLYVTFAYVAALTDDYPEHDLSKLKPLEFTLNVYARTQEMQDRALHFLHYWNNSHHPGHRALRELCPDLEGVLSRKTHFSEVVEHLKTIEPQLKLLEHDARESPHLWMNEAESREFVYYLCARRWQKDLAEYRGINGVMLTAIPPRFLYRPWVPINIVTTHIEEIANKPRSYLRFDVQTRVKRDSPYLYP